jgi:hypothetical protein
MELGAAVHALSTPSISTDNRSDFKISVSRRAATADANKRRLRRCIGEYGPKHLKSLPTAFERIA